MTEFVNRVSDLISTYWPQILAILSSTTFIYLVLKFLFQFILIKVRAKENKKTNSETLKKYEELEKKLDTFVGSIESVFMSMIEKNQQLTKEQFNSLFEKYQKTKQTYMNAIISANKETQELLETAKEIKKEAEEQAKQQIIEDENVENTNENTENIENIAEIEPEEQQVEEEVKEEENEENSEYIVVEKIYGE